MEVERRGLRNAVEMYQIRRDRGLRSLRVMLQELNCYE
jgi:hypothetical protein